MAKRNPSNTVTEQASSFAAARNKLAAPKTLSKAAVPFWNSIAATRAPEEWSPCDLAVAEQLAEDQALQVSLRARLDAEGWTTPNGKTRAEASLLDTVSRRVFSASRLLQIHPRGRTGQQSRDVVARRKAAHKAIATLDEMDSESLIATH